MYTPGKLIYFDPFYFKNDTASKPKFFLVLKVIKGGTAIIASLPSSVNHLPESIIPTHGCLEFPEMCVNCYVFDANRPITTSGWSFPKITMLYGNWIDDFDVQTLHVNHSIEGVDFDIVGELTDAELQSIIHCFASSGVVKRKYKRLLSE